MSKFIGRKLNVGIGKESVRGTAVVATFSMPKMELTHDEMIEQAIDESSVGVIEDSQSADITKKDSQAELRGRINNESFGLWLLAAIGSESAPVAVGGDPTVYDHTFSVLETAQHPSLTISIEEPNATGASALRYALSVVDSLEINLELGKYAEYNVGFRGKKSVTGTFTPSYPTTENIFLPHHGEFKLATSLAGLDAASATQIKSINFTVSKNLEDDQVIGNVEPIDRLNKMFAIEGTIELLYEDRSFIDTILLGDLAKAMRVRFANTAVTIGVGSNPRLTFDFAKVKFSEVARTLDNNEIVRQTLTFKAFYSLADAKMLSVVLRNLQSSAY